MPGVKPLGGPATRGGHEGSADRDTHPFEPWNAPGYTWTSIGTPAAASLVA